MVAASATLLAGCAGSGFADQSAEEIASATEKDMKALSSVSMKGEIASDGQEIALDLSLNTDGECEGSITLQGGTAELRSTGSESWMKPDQTFWETFAGPSASQIVEIVGDRWVVIPEGTQDFASFCDLDELLEDLNSDEDDPGEVEGTEELDGEDVVVINTETDEGDPLTVYVRTDEPHYLLKMEVSEGEEPGQFTFADFDEELDVQAPPEDEVVDLNQLGG